MPLLTSGCALTPQKMRQGKRHLNQAEKLIDKGDYEGALKEDKQAANLLSGISPGDKALFHMGLIWAHPDNPKRDYGKALECFQQVAHNFPNSSLKEDVRVWIGAINELILRESRIKDRDATINELKKDYNSLKETEARVEGKNKDLEESVKALKKQLNALKEIDLGIEEKKREDSPGKTNR